MSISDQDQAVDVPIATSGTVAEPESQDAAEAPAPPDTEAEAQAAAEGSGSRDVERTPPGAGPDVRSETVPEALSGPGPEAASEAGDRRLTPRQARRLRVVLSSVGMAAMAVVLVLRIAARSSVLVVGVYGLALILCGIVIELSRNGRTRLGSWLLALGLLAAIGSDWLLIP
ncbi:hypothetical protein AB0L71_24150 [Streptomyces sp. NPDC052052]|uniref:hypothetical protein n=1 Tax=Streptomyces sp. NPDC052052 TaxID=3154756 RepID=UPI0034262F4E